MCNRRVAISPITHTIAPQAASQIAFPDSDTMAIPPPVTDLYAGANKFQMARQFTAQLGLLGLENVKGEGQDTRGARRRVMELNMCQGLLDALKVWGLVVALRLLVRPREPCCFWVPGRTELWYWLMSYQEFLLHTYIPSRIFFVKGLRILMCAKHLLI